MNRSIPILNTAHLTLRGMRPEDFERFAEIWADADVVRHIIGKPRSRGEAWDSFLRNAGHWQMTGFGQWAIMRQSDRQVIGQTGFFYGNRSLGDDFDPFPEAGWMLASKAQGQGYGFEAAQAAHDWFDRVIPGPLVAVVDTANLVSATMAQRLGYKLLRTTEFGAVPVNLFRRDGPPSHR